MRTLLLPSCLLLLWTLGSAQAQHSHPYQLLTDSPLSSIPSFPLEQLRYRTPLPSLLHPYQPQEGLLLDGMPLLGVQPLQPLFLLGETNTLRQLPAAHTLAPLELQTRTPAFSAGRELHGSLYAGYQSATQGKDLSLSLQQGSPRWSWRYAATYRKHQDYRDGNGTLQPYSAFGKFNQALQASLQLPQGHVLSLQLLTDRASNMGLPGSGMTLSPQAQTRTALGYTYQGGHSGQSLQWIKARLYYGQLQQQLRLQESYSLLPSKGNTYGLLAEGLWTYDKHLLQLRADLHSRQEQSGHGRSPLLDARRTLGTLALEDTYALGEQLSVKMEAQVEMARDRYDRQEGGRAQSRDRIAPLLQAALGDRAGTWQWEALLAYREVLPTMAALYAQDMPNLVDGYRYQGHSDLKSEKRLQGMFSLRYAGQGWKLEAKAYHHRIANLIMARLQPSALPVGTAGSKAFENANSASLSGITLAGQGKIAPSLQWEGEVHYQYGRLQDGMPMPMLPPFYTLQRLRLQQGGWFAQVEAEAAAAQRRPSTAFGERDTPAYLLLNLHTGYEWMLGTQRLQLLFGVDNLTDAAYHTHLDWGNMLRPGKNLQVSLAWGW